MNEPSTDAPPRPTGRTEGLEIDGILEGRVGDAAALRAALARLDSCGFGRFQCEFTGSRYSLMPLETSLPGAGIDIAEQEQFFAALADVAAATAKGSLESTLRCQLLYREQVVETLFAVRDHVIGAVSRVRPRGPGERAIEAAPPAMPLGLRRRELVWLAAGLLIVGAGLAWRSGYVDAVFAARAEDLSISTGPFGDLVAVKLTRNWGSYEVEVSRGATFPADPQALAALQGRADSLERRAACEVVGNGGEIWLQLRDSGDHLLASASTDLRPLLSVGGKVTVRLPGHIAAHAVAVTLTSGREEKR